MEILAKLTPAEAYLIKNTSNSTFKELLKLTLADLSFKKVLKIEDREVRSHPSNPVRVLKYVVATENFHAYHPKAHEEAFLSPFQKNPELEILFHHLIKMAYESARNRKRYVFKSMLKSPEIGGKFHKDFFTRLTGVIALTSEGKKVKAKVDEALSKLETELPQIIQHDKKGALGVLEKIGGNVFLISGLEFQLLKELDEELAKAHERRSGDYDFGCSGCYTSYGDHADSFDGAFDGVDSSGGGGSGCSGDSGCSGCSGCGGCGGCGG
ncbi:MAG: hypothetical protein AAGA66_09330 [Bacteroidota bacterium]